MIKTITSKIKGSFLFFNKRINNRFFCFLPSKLGPITSFLLPRIYSGISMNQDQIDLIKNIPKNSIIIFVSKYKSNFEFLFSHTRNKEVGLPIPNIAFDYHFYFFQPLVSIIKIFKIFITHIKYIFKNKKLSCPYESNYYKEKILKHKCAFLSLIKEKDFYLRFVKKRKNPLEYLIEIQKEINQPIYIVSQLMFYGRNPIPSEPPMLDMIFGSAQKSSFLRKITTLIRYPGKIFVEFSKPLDLQFWITQTEYENQNTQHQAVILRRDILKQQDRHYHTITGPTIKSLDEVKETILTNQRMRIFMENYSHSKKIPLKIVRKKADSFVNEIAARYNLSLIKIMSYVINWIINSAFDGAVVDRKGLNKIKTMSNRGPLILVPCHKSHVDYLILSYLLYQNNMPCPHVAAGKNLSFWPLGSLFRSCGAFFIRRTFKGEKLYTKVLSEYIKKLLEEGFNIEIFIEGGRSRTGKLLNPKLGLISILLDAFRSGVCEDMIFVPVYVGYDRIIEEYAYIHEVEGGSKRPENFSQVIKARKFLKKRYGKIYVNFHEPISLKDMILNEQISSSDLSKNNNFAICQDIGNRIMTAIDKETIITAHGLTAAAILNLSQNIFTRKKIMKIANTYLLFAISQNAKIADTLILSPDKALENAFIEYKHRKLIEETHNSTYNTSQETLYLIKNNKRSLLEFYKNNCISYFIHAATVALAILDKDAFQFCASDLHQHHKILIKLFKYEFSIDSEITSESFVRKTIKGFINDAMLMPNKTIPDTYNITSSGYRKLKFYATFLRPYLESYMVVLQFFKTNKNYRYKFSLKDKIKKIQSMGSFMHKKGEISLIESVSKNNYTNGIKFFNELNNQNNSKKISDYLNIIIQQLKLITK